MKSRIESKKLSLEQFHFPSSFKFSAPMQEINDVDVLEVIIPFLKNHRNIKILELRGNNIGTKGAEYLVDFLMNPNSIITIDLSFNQIGTEGALAFAKLLHYTSTLNELNLRKNGIQGFYGDVEKDQISTLVTAYAKNKNLRALDLSWNAMSKSTKKRYETICEMKNQDFNGRMIVNFELKEHKKGMMWSDRIFISENGEFYFDLMINCMFDHDNKEHEKLIDILIDDRNNHSIGLMAPTACNNKFKRRDLFHHKAVFGDMISSPSIVRNVYKSKCIFTGNILCGELPFFYASDGSFFQLLSCINETIEFLKSHNAIVNFDVIDIMRKLQQLYEKTGFSKYSPLLDPAIDYLKSDYITSHADGLLQLYCFSGFVFSKAIDKNIKNVKDVIEFIIPLLGDVENKESINDLIAKFNLCQKIKLFTPVLGHSALDGGFYAWSYTEWNFIRDSNFVYDNDIKRMVVDVSKDINPQSGYSMFYAVGKDNHNIFVDELVEVFKILGLSVENNLDFHEKIIFSEESSKKLLEMGLDIDVNNIKKIVQAKK